MSSQNNFIHLQKCLFFLQYIHFVAMFYYIPFDYYYKKKIHSLFLYAGILVYKELTTSENKA